MGVGDTGVTSYPPLGFAPSDPPYAAMGMLGDHEEYESRGQQEVAEQRGVCESGVLEHGEDCAKRIGQPEETDWVSFDSLVGAVDKVQR